MRTTRRSFVKGIAYAGASIPWVAPRLVRAASPNGKLRHSSVGTEGMGWVDINAITKDPRVEVVAFCDVDVNRQQQAAGKFPGAARYQDWRVLLDKEHANIDSVNIAIPDHMHAPVSVSAMSLGKHVYCQKPLTHSLHEARQMRLISEREKLVTQMGIQGHASIRNRLTVQTIRQGLIGKVREVHIWVPHPGDVYMQGMGRPTNTEPPPANLDWDLWLGVAPQRPFTSAYPSDSPHAGKPVYHPFYWRAWCDFGTGALGDIGCHAMDPIVSALNLGPPTAVVSQGPPPNDETYPEWSVVRYTFPATKLTAGPLTLTWYNGGKTPPIDLLPENDRGLFDAKGGTLYIGESGMVLGGPNAPRLLPSEKFTDHKHPKLDDRDHYHQWTSAVLGEGNATANFSYAGPLTETVLLGNIAMLFPNQPLAWDAESFRVANVPSANDLLRREYRQGWKIGELSR